MFILSLLFTSLDYLLSMQQALENSGLSVVQPQGDTSSRDTQNPATEGAAAESKKLHLLDKPVRERKRSIFKKPVQMPGKENISMMPYDVVIKVQ